MVDAPTYGKALFAFSDYLSQLKPYDELSPRSTRTQVNRSEIVQSFVEHSPAFARYAPSLMAMLNSTVEVDREKWNNRNGGNLSA